MYCPEECGSSFIVSGGDGSVMFQFFEEIFDQMAGFVECFVIIAGLFAIGFWRNDRLNIYRTQSVNHPFVRIVSFVCKQNVGPDAADQNVRAVQIAGLSGCQVKCQRIAQSVAGRMDFRAQSAF